LAIDYSKRSLVERLGIKKNFRIIITNQPKNYNKMLGKLPKGVVLSKKLKGPFDFIHLFTKRREELEERFPILKQELSQKGMLWISWPKVFSKIETDLNENMVREIGLKNRLVDTKICAINEDWSGLKFVYKLKDRK